MYVMNLIQYATITLRRNIVWKTYEQNILKRLCDEKMADPTVSPLNREPWPDTKHSFACIKKTDVVIRTGSTILIIHILKDIELYNKIKFLGDLY